MKDKIVSKIKNKEARIGIIGMGYVGLPLAREFLKKGFTILGFDIDESKVKSLNKGKSYIKHIKDDFLKEFVLKKKLFSATIRFFKVEGSGSYFDLCSDSSR